MRHKGSHKGKTPVLKARSAGFTTLAELERRTGVRINICRGKAQLTAHDRKILEDLAEELREDVDTKVSKA